MPVVQSSGILQGEPNEPSWQVCWTQMLVMQSVMLSQGESTEPSWQV